MNKITVEQFVMELKRWYDDNLIKYLPDIVTDRFYEVLAKASQIEDKAGGVIWPSFPSDMDQIIMSSACVQANLGSMRGKFSKRRIDIAIDEAGKAVKYAKMVKEKILSHPSPKPTTYEEWRKTLSPEEQDESDRELARLVREHESVKPTESLAELADRKGMKINISRSKKEWSIGIRHKGTGTDKKGPIIAYHSMLYEGIEIYARAYLETLKDRRME